jgi:cellulose synthase/poly-beta-1,6-N-acetylglucosamine synthase-like glycosyltransferase
MTTSGVILIVLSFGLVCYTYIGYPLLLRLLSGAAPADQPPALPGRQWPLISICLPVYNEEYQLRECLESLLAIDYPADRRQILVISDASSDGTDAIVQDYAKRGIELLRMPVRGGKTRAENHAAGYLCGDIIINTDASIRIRPDAVKALIHAFSDSSVGVASGRDISVAAATEGTVEGGYVGYEMKVRSWETRAGGIIGASGCFYAIRSELHRAFLPDFLSRDFASVLIAREHGFKAVSVDSAVCLVPRTRSLRVEYRRKVRTMSRGMETLWHKRGSLNPFTNGLFAWKLFSHKVCRWLTPWCFVTLVLGLGLLAAEYDELAWFAIMVLAAAAFVGIGWRRTAAGYGPRWLLLPTGIAVVSIATMYSFYRALRGSHDPTWEPTRRPAVAAGENSAAIS